MLRNLRGPGRHLRRRSVALALLIGGLSACAPAIGGAVLVTVVTIGALTSHCYDYIDVTVYDPQGRRTCAATVTAINGSDQFELKSCYYAPLSDGRWTLRATLPGYPEAVSTVDVDHEKDCTRHVQSLELTLAGAPSTARPLPGAASVPALPPAPAAPPAATASSSPPAAAPPAPTPAASGAPPASQPSDWAPPSSPGVGVFPDQPHPAPPK